MKFFWLGANWQQWYTPPPLFKSVRSDEYAWNAIFSKSTWYGDLKSDVYTIYRRYIGYAGGYMDDI